MSEPNESGKIAVTGATGHLGRLVIESLLDRGVAPSNIVAAVRNPVRASDLAARGVEIREADYTKPETLSKAFDGVEKLLLVSSSEVGQRSAQHKNVIEAAKEAGVKLLAYTSLLKADTSKMALGGEHKETEKMIRESGIPFVFLRNGWYIENYQQPIEQAAKTGVLYGAAGDGKISAATRADYAEAAAAVLSGPVEPNSIFELGGDTAFTLADLAQGISDNSGLDVEYKDLSEEDYAALLISAGLPEPYANVLADSDTGIARGDLFTDSGDLSKLIGRPTTTIAEAVRAAHTNHHRAKKAA